MLGLTLFINDIDVNISSLVLMFADDTKLYSDVCTCDHMDRLLCDLDKLSKWSNKWLMLFNADKCKCFHVGHSYLSVDYIVSGVEIKNVTAGKGLGVAICCTLGSSLHYSKLVSTANEVLCIIKRTYVHKSQRNIMYLYMSLVTPHLRYCCQDWQPYLQRDIDNIKKEEL